MRALLPAFCAMLFCVAQASAQEPVPDKRIALSFDDVPRGAGGDARIAAYAAAGHVIANHSHDHTRLSQTEAADYLADLNRAGAWLAGRPGYWPWFRHPCLDKGARDAQPRLSPIWMSTNMISWVFARRVLRKTDGK